MKTKIIMLPTEDSKIGDFIIMKDNNPLSDNKGKLSCGIKKHNGNTELFPEYHLYAVTDEEIKEGNWYLDTYPFYAAITEEAKAANNSPMKRGKIIATTDPKLKIYKFKSGVFKNLEYSLPQIPQLFIKEYCETGGIDEVEIEMEEWCLLNTGHWCRESKLKAGMIVEKWEERIKINKNNIINIKPIKTSWNKEEVENLINSFADHVYKGYYVHKWDVEDILDTTEKWINENLK